MPGAPWREEGTATVGGLPKCNFEAYESCLTFVKFSQPGGRLSTWVWSSRFGNGNKLIMWSRFWLVSPRLGTSSQCLLLTGPNAGGKTVVLKTLGLLALLVCSSVLQLSDVEMFHDTISSWCFQARCGIPIPGGEAPRVDFFEARLLELTFAKSRLLYFEQRIMERCTAILFAISHLWQKMLCSCYTLCKVVLADVGDMQTIASISGWDCSISNVQRILDLAALFPLPISMPLTPSLR